MLSKGTCDLLQNTILSKIDIADLSRFKIGNVRRPTTGGGQSFPFLKLPPELRLMIYKPLIAAGDLNIMRTNKQIYGEAASVLKHDAVLRVNFGRGRRKSPAFFPLIGTLSLGGNFTLHATPVIQRVEFRFHMRGPNDHCYAVGVYSNLIRSFGGRVIVRQLCTIIMNLGGSDGAFDHDDYFAREKVWRAITNLTGFKTLIFKIRPHDMTLNEGRYSQRLLLRDYESFRGILETRLGPAILDKRPQGHCLEFHPSEFKPQENQKTDGKL